KGEGWDSDQGLTHLCATILLSDFCAHCVAGALRPISFKWETVSWISFPGVEIVHGSEAGHLRIAQYFDRVLKFVTDQAHEVAVNSPNVQHHPQHTIRSSLRHVHEAGLATMPACTHLDIDNAVGGADGLNEIAECARPFGCVLDHRRDNGARAPDV